MTVQILNTRSLVSGVRAGALLEGQIFFNLPDRLMFVGDGSAFQTDIDGSTTPCPLGEGWFEVAMTIPELDDWFLISPQHYGDIPTDGQFLQWDDTLNHSIWSDIATPGGASYQTTNAAVAAAPGATTSDKIDSVLGAVSLVQGDTVIVSGVSGDIYQGFYVYSGIVWNFAALYSSPTAANVSFDNTGTTLAATEVQAALVELDTDVVAAQAYATQALADAATAQIDATQALADAAAAQATADAALPLTGGTMTGPIVFDAGQNIPISGIPDASTSTKGIVQVGTNIQVSSGVISVESATTSVPGVVQLNDTTSSTSIVEALTANQGFSLQQQIDALVIANNLTLGGTIYGSTGLLASVTPEGTLAGLNAGSALPSPGPTNLEIFVIVVDTGTMTPPGGTPTLVHVGDWWLSDGTSWVLLDVGYQFPYATTTQVGVVQLATNSEVQAGLETTHAVVPSSLQSKLSDEVTLVSNTTIATSTAAKTAYDAAVAARATADAAQATANAAQATADAAVPDSSFVALGDLLVGSGAGTYVALSSGAADTLLSSDGAGNLSWIPVAPDGVLGITGTSPVTVDNTDPANPVVGIDAASTTASGAVQLDDTVDNISTTVAATANAVKTAYDAAVAAQTTADAAIPQSLISAQGDIVVGTSFSVAGTLPLGTDGYILTANSGTTTGLEWSAAAPDGVIGVTGTSPVTVDNTDPANPIVGIDTSSTTQLGAVQLATDVETQSGTNTTAAVTPSSLQSKMSDSTSLNDSLSIASSTAVAAAYTLANNALPKSGGTMTGQITLAAAQTISGGTF